MHPPLQSHKIWKQTAHVRTHTKQPIQSHYRSALRSQPFNLERCWMLAFGSTTIGSGSSRRGSVRTSLTGGVCELAKDTTQEESEKGQINLHQPRRVKKRCNSHRQTWDRLTDERDNPRRRDRAQRQKFFDFLNVGGGDGFSVKSENDGGQKHWKSARKALVHGADAIWRLG